MGEPSQADLDFLAGIPIFGGLPDAQLSTIYHRSERHEFAPEQVLVKEGDLGDAVYVLLKGQVVVRKGARPEILGTLGPGDCIGEMAIIDIQPRSASVFTTESTTVLRLDCPTLFQIQREDLGAYTMLVMNCAREISRRLRTANTRILLLEAQLRAS